MPEAAIAGTWLGLLNGVCLFALASIRRRSINAAQVGPAAEVFFASYNLWPPLYLFSFAVDPAKRATLPPALHGYEIFLAVAAFCSLLLTFVGIISLYVRAWKAPVVVDGAAE